jgi:beta-lactam-binding protein with PASTA domain
MLVCDTCGTENPDGAQFCSACSAFIWQAAPPSPSGAAGPDPVSVSGPRPVEPSAPPPAAGRRATASPPPLPAPNAAVHAPDEPLAEPATPPSWFRRRSSRGDAAGAPADVDLPADVAPAEAPSLRDVPTGVAADAVLTARPPDRVPAVEPPAATGRRPQQALAIKLDQPEIEVQPGATASFRVTVRNTGALVEGCSVSVRGIPTAWQRMEPDRFNLDVDGQCDVQVHITPPRSPKTVEGRTALAIVVRSEVDDQIEQRADATLVIAPYLDLSTGLEPVEIEGKRGGRTYVNIENRGNKTEHLGLAGTEPGGRLRFTFRPGELEVRPGQRASVVVDARARRRVWSGIERSRQFSIAVERGDGPPLPPLAGRFTQQASWPRWVLPVVFALLAIAIPTTLLLVNRSLNTSAANAPISIPKVVGLTADAAKQSLQGKGLVADAVNVFRAGSPGQVVDQDPPAGQKVAKGTTVKLSVSTDRTVPDLKGKPWQVAKDQLAAAQLTLVFGGWVPSDDDTEGQVNWQVPDPGQPSPDGQVTVGVNQGRTQFKMIEVRGLDQVSTQTNLVNSGLKVEIQMEDSDKQRGIIIDQFPAADTVLKKGDTVTLIVSSGHPPVSTSALGASPGGATPSSPVTSS